MFAKERRQKEAWSAVASAESIREGMIATIIPSLMVCYFPHCEKRLSMRAGGHVKPVGERGSRQYQPKACCSCDGLTPARRTLMILFNTSNQNGAPFDVARPVISNPIPLRIQPVVFSGRGALVIG